MARDKPVVTTMADARRRCLEALSVPGASLRAASFGYMGFPGTHFRRPQGAAFASAKLKRHMLADGIVRPARRLGICTGTYEITSKDRLELATEPT